jgi:hypothetical protein
VVGCSNSISKEITLKKIVLPIVLVLMLAAAHVAAAAEPRTEEER